MDDNTVDSDRTETENNDTNLDEDHKRKLEQTREDDGQEYLDRDKLDFDPDDGLLSGTAVDGTSKIPGPHEEGPDVDDKEAGPGESEAQDDSE